MINKAIEKALFFEMTYLQTSIYIDAMYESRESLSVDDKEIFDKLCTELYVISNAVSGTALYFQRQASDIFEYEKKYGVSEELFKIIKDFHFHLRPPTGVSKFGKIDYYIKNNKI